MLVKRTDLKKVTHQVVDSDPAVKTFILPGHDGSVSEVESMTLEVALYVSQDNVGPLWIFLPFSKNKPKSYLYFSHFFIIQFRIFSDLMLNNVFIM